MREPMKLLSCKTACSSKIDSGLTLCYLGAKWRRGLLILGLWALMAGGLPAWAKPAALWQGTPVVLGVQAYQQGHYTLATHYLRQATQTTLCEPIAYYYLGASLSQQRDFLGAQQAFQQAILMAPGTYAAEKSHQALQTLSQE